MVEFCSSGISFTTTSSSFMHCSTTTVVGDDQSQLLSHEDNQYCSNGSLTKTTTFKNCSTTVGDDQSQLFHRPLFDVTYKRSWSLIIILLAMLMSLQNVSGSCKAGSFPYHDIIKGEVCKLCPVGSYSFAAQNNCTTCSPGTFTAKIGTSAPCPCCPGGKYANSITGATTCSSCNEYISGSWSLSCSNTKEACSTTILPPPTYEPTGQPTRQPTSNPTNPTGQPTHQPTQQVTIYFHEFFFCCIFYFFRVSLLVSFPNIFVIMDMYLEWTNCFLIFSIDLSPCSQHFEFTSSFFF